MQRDFRATPEFGAVEGFYRDLFCPGAGHVYDAIEVAPTPSGRDLYLTGLCFETSLEAGPTSHLYRLNPATGAMDRLFAQSGRMPRPSPVTDALACVLKFDDGKESVCIGTPAGDIREIFEIEGLVEQVEWSADGKHLLLLIAGEGADLAGYQGGHATNAAQEGPDWLPEVQTGQEANLWRRLWVLDLETEELRQVSKPSTNVWEACWLGGDRAACVCSDDHGEGSWYRANLRAISIDDGSEQVLHTPADQIGFPAASPDGRYVAFIGAVCSDRGIVCGQLTIAEVGGRVVECDTLGVEVTSLSWRDGDVIQYSGQDAFETALGDFSVSQGRAEERWRSKHLTFGQWYPSAKPLPSGASIVVAEAYDIAPHLVIIDAAGALTPVRSFEAPRARLAMEGRGRISPEVWSAPDGLEIHGWLVSPAVVNGPAPLILDIHGGPIWAYRHRWMGRGRATPLLAKLGCAVLYVNPRGSSTRGQAFARLVQGDMGGADTNDFLSAVDHLVAKGVADVTRLACTGTSYGGFMSAWLVTQDQRFAAAAPISPVSNWFSQHRTSQIPYFDAAFLDGNPSRADGKFFTRSPVMFADRVTTPCLVLAGALDKNTPPTQALEFHQSLREAGADSALVIYPKDGHSLRGYPAYIDTAARILSWFGTHLRLDQTPS